MWTYISPHQVIYIFIIDQTTRALEQRHPGVITWGRISYLDLVIGSGRRESYDETFYFFYLGFLAAGVCFLMTELIHNRLRNIMACFQWASSALWLSVVNSTRCGAVSKRLEA
ncbi:hypothetical protein BDZ94DRAFT_479842 [Collybia nuda]|uniref:Uncharacterized protein n=1 Tax=Collybia nuda TaxID=64659 RepID=A0A9P6CG24_9AGAR|nr:hypothetical protein BDZ94DRAFT_479842 [Collybia nuda]